MPTYKLTDPVYGRTLNIDLEKPPTQEEASQYLANTFSDDKEYTFSNLKKDKQYMSDLRGNWKDEGNDDYEGDDSELVEKDFEYWNSVEFNLGKGAIELATTFANLEPKEAQRMLRRFDVYDKTNATGEGSREFSEQFKGVTWAMITDPTTYVGGYGLLKNLVARSGAKSLLKSILMKAAVPMTIGAGYGAAADAEHQIMMMQLGAQEDYSGEQTGVAAAFGAGTSVIAPIAAKTAAKAARTSLNMLQPTKWKSGIQSVEEATMETLGGAQVAKKGTIEEAQKTLAHGGEGHADASIAASNSLNDELTAGVTKFTNEYKALGQFDVRPQHLISILDKLKEDGMKGLGNIEYYIELMKKGESTPTDTLRLIRSQLGKLQQASFKDGNANHGGDKVLGRYHKDAKELFNAAAERVGKGKEAKDIDGRYGEFMGIYNRNDIIKASGQSGKASDLIAHIVSSPDKSYLRVNEYLTEISKIGKSSGNKEFVSEQKKLLAISLSEFLFKGKGGKFETFATTESGKKTLLALFDDLTPKSLNRWSTILENSAKHGGASTFWGRMLSQTLAGSVGGAALGLVGAGISFITMGKLLKSHKFQDMAMRVYSKKEVSQKALNRVEKYLLNNGLDEKQTKWFIANMTGMAVTKATTAERPEGVATQYADEVPNEF
ncbi:MAG: hypothetical protein HOE35_07225 [Candidatus Ruthia sp.]|jgi:hypothetical protein|nr:hypothetical protein [Candidatus Ruthturnera sp.]